MHQLVQPLIRRASILERKTCILATYPKCQTKRSILDLIIGKEDKLYSRNNGNFLKLVEFIGKFDIGIAEHLRRITSKESHVHYLGKNIQNEVIELLGSTVKQNILAEVSKWIYYSIILDCTPDVSHTEQMTLVIRFVRCESGKEPCIQEKFLGFVPINSSTGEALTDIILAQLEEMEILLQNMRGQGYDNGANMKGKHAGVQSRILKLNPREFFVPCSAHSLNLVVNDAALSCNEAVAFFSIVQEMYNYFTASTHRWSILKKNVSTLTVKPLSGTRWESRIDAVTPLRYQVGEINDALYELSTDPTSDAFGKHNALYLARKLKSFKFVCCVTVWHIILFRINLISKVLQTENINVSKAVELIANIKLFFQEIRSDKAFEEMIVDAKEIAETLDIEAQFAAESEVRPRKIKRQFDWESHDESTTDPKMSFKHNFFFYILDRAITSVDERFNQLTTHNDIFGFLYDIKNHEKGELLRKCIDLQSALTDKNHSDIDGVQLHQELLVLISLLPDKDVNDPLELLKYITTNRLGENFPNISVGLRILLTLPVTVASGERSFSKLKLIKNYLRSTMSQERLVGLAMMSIEFDVLQKG